MRIEAHRNENQLWLERFYKGTKDSVHNLLINLIACIGRQRHVDDAFLRMRRILDPTGAGVETMLVLVHRQKTNPLILEKCCLCPIAVMRIVVNDQHALHATFNCRSCSDRDIVEDTKSHCTVRFSVMPGRADDGKRVLRVASYYCARA